MSGALDAKARLTAENLLKKFGKVGNYKNEVAGSYDPLTGNTGAAVVTLIPITCYINEPTTGQIQAGLAVLGDAIILVSAKELGIGAVAGDDIVFSDKAYEIKKDMPIYSGELIALHQLVCTRR